MIKKRRFLFVLIAAIFLAAFPYFHSLIERYIYPEPSEEKILINTKLYQIKKNGTLRAGMLDSFTSKNNSIDLDLIRLFSRQISTDLLLIKKKTLNELFKALENDEIDIIASGMSLLPKDKTRFFSSPPYLIVSQEFVYRLGNNFPLTIKNVKLPIHVPNESAQIELLESLKETENSRLKWIIEENLSFEQIAKKIAENTLPYTILESHKLAKLQLIYPNLASAFTINDSQPIGWLMKKSDDFSLMDSVSKFIFSITDNTILGQIIAKNYEHIRNFDYFDTATFVYNIENKLENFKPQFMTAAKKYHFDWKLIAAMSYQESHWNPNATSPTGVRGIMMLTQSTAQELGVKDRLNSEESILGGTKYLYQIIRKLPNSIHQNEKIWFALAAYNIGIAHLYDVMRLAEKHNANPYSWDSVKQFLPLLNQEKYSNSLKYGKADGEQTYRFVQNIRRYQFILTEFFAKEN